MKKEKTRGSQKTGSGLNEWQEQTASAELIKPTGPQWMWDKWRKPIMELELALTNSPAADTYQDAKHTQTADMHPNETDNILQFPTTTMGVRQENGECGLSVCLFVSIRITQIGSHREQGDAGWWYVTDQHFFKQKIGLKNNNSSVADCIIIQVVEDIRWILIVIPLVCPGLFKFSGQAINRGYLFSYTV